VTAVGTKLTPKKRDAFLLALASTGNVTVAAQMAEVTRTHVYEWRKTDGAFARAWDDAIDQAADLLEAEARRRAYEGVQRLKFDRGNVITIPLIGADGKPVIQDGEPVMVPYIEHEYSDTLLIFLLKGARPETYRERTDVRHSGKIDVSKLSDDELRAIVEG
jgi:hypothetical protein